jgi:iron complex outermembrane recepter protein
MKARHIHAVCCASFLSAPALAQSAAPPPSSSPAIGEIVVTAQKRSERLSEVPLSITAVSAETLAAAGAKGTSDLTTLVPAMNFVTNGAFANPTIRGVGSTVVGAGADANVAFYIDGVYRPNQTANLTDLVDVDSINVLKGPQGTLFGRNATGGAITITTRKPSFDPVLELNASYGNFADTRFTGYASDKLAEGLAASVSGIYENEQGYVYNLGTGHTVGALRTRGGRAKLLWEASPTVRFTLSGGYLDHSDPSSFEIAPLDGNAVYLSRPGVIAPQNARQVSLSFDPTIRSKTTDVSLRGEVDFGFLTLTSISAYLHYSTASITDSDRVNLPILSASLPGKERTFSQEFDLVSRPGRLQGFAGLFYYNDHGVLATYVNGVGPLNRQDTWAFAPFGELDYKLTDKLTVIGGLRYNIENKDYTGVKGATRIHASKTFYNLTPRASIKYAINPHNNLYATYSQGFKSGLFDTNSFSTNVVKPEKITSYEVGYKYSRAWISASIAGYYYQYKNIQFTALAPTGTGLSFTYNAARARNYGIDGEINIQPTHDLTLRLGGSWIHARYTDFPNAIITEPKPGGAGNYVVPLGGVDPVTGLVNTDGAKGKRVIRTPEFSGSATVTWRHEIQDGAAIDASATGFYSGTFYWNPQNRLKQPHYALLNGDIGFTFPGSRFRLSLWGKNLTNKLYQMYTADSALGDSVAYARPRTYGISAGFKLR